MFMYNIINLLIKNQMGRLVMLVDVHHQKNNNYAPSIKHDLPNVWCFYFMNDTV